MEELLLTVDEPLKLRGLEVGVVWADNVTVRPASLQLKGQIEALIEQVRAQDLPSESLRQAVRNLLRTKAFKPTGRSKPASEYLSQAAKEGRFPFINNLVDINNYLSLKSGCPISRSSRTSCRLARILAARKRPRNYCRLGKTSNSRYC